MDWGHWKLDFITIWVFEYAWYGDKWIVIQFHDTDLPIVNVQLLNFHSALNENLHGHVTSHRNFENISQDWRQYRSCW